MARKRSRAKFQVTVTKLRTYRATLKLRRAKSQILRALMGVRYRAENVLWSDMTARHFASRSLATLMARHYREAPAGRSYYMLSFADDCGTTSDRVPHLAIKQLTEKVRRAITALELHAFVMLEVHPLTNYPGGGDGRFLLLGAHAIAWADLPFDHDTHAAALCASPAWQCTLGARPVDIEPIEPGTIESVAYYLMKQVPSAKNFRPDAKANGRHKMMDTTKGYRDELAFRLFEGQSQVELASVMFGIGDGSRVRQAIREAVTNWHRARREPMVVPKTFDVWAFWHQLRQSHGSKRFLPYRYDGGAIKPRVVVRPPHAPATAPETVAAVVTEAVAPRPAAAIHTTNFFGEAVTALVAQQADAQSSPRTSQVKRKRGKPPRGRATRPHRIVLGPRQD